MHAIRYIVLSDFPPPHHYKPKKFAPSLTGDINPQKIPLKQCKNDICL